MSHRQERQEAKNRQEEFELVGDPHSRRPFQEVAARCDTSWRFLATIRLRCFACL
jgi:hypothetical protein